MKKLFFPAVVIAAITLASCSKQEDVTGVNASSESTPISFSTFVGKSGGTNTKGTVADKDGLKTNNGGLLVSAYNTAEKTWINYLNTGGAPEFMKEQKVIWNGTNSVWEYTPLRYWPVNSGKVSFFAIASNNSTDAKPDGVTNWTYPNSDTGKGPVFQYTANGTIGNQSDLVYTVALNQTSANNPVQLTFNHILTKIGFSAKLQSSLPSNVALNVTGLKITTSNSLGTVSTFRYIIDPSNNDKSAWDELSTGGSQVYLTASDVSLGTFTPGIELSANDSKRINDANMFIMLPPQTVTAGSFTVNIFYNITDKNVEPNLITSYSSGPISLPTSTTGSVVMEQGKQYTFNFTFSLVGVQFADIIVNEWGSGSLSEGL
jgi:hypothetical protein